MPFPDLPVFSAAAETITPADIRCVALPLVEQHGAQALAWAHLAAEDMKDQGQAAGETAWRVVCWEVMDALEGRIRADAPLVIH